MRLRLLLKLDFQDIELLVSIFPFLVDACKDLMSCKCISRQGLEQRPMLFLRVAWRFPSFVCILLLLLGWRGVSGVPALGSAWGRDGAGEEPVLSTLQILGEKEVFWGVWDVSAIMALAQALIISHPEWGEYMYTYVLYIYIYIFIYVHAHASIYIHICMYIYLYVCICVYNDTKSFRSLLWGNFSASGIFLPDSPKTKIKISLRLPGQIYAPTQPRAEPLSFIPVLSMQ